MLLLNGVIYTSWASHCDINPYTAWIIGYSQSTLAQTSVLNLTPNGSEGSIWQSGGGPAADAQGNIYALVANGTSDTTLDANGFPINHDYGNAFVKISTTGGSLQVADYFNMSNTVTESGGDVDLGSGGAMVLPDSSYGTGSTLQLAVGAGKDGNIYVVDRTNMGKYSATANNVYQEIHSALPNGVWGVPAYFNNTVYYCDVNSTLKSFSIANGKLSSTPVHTGCAVHLSGSAAQHFRERQFQRHRLGHRKYRHGRPARIPRERSHAGALQQQPGGEWPRSFRQREQVHHAHDRRRESFCGDDE